MRQLLKKLSRKDPAAALSRAPLLPADAEPDTVEISRTFEAFLEEFRRHDNFSWSKINHGFWEELARIEQQIGWPQDEAGRRKADDIGKRTDFFVGGFVDELIQLLETARTDPDPALHLCYSLSAWPSDDRYTPVPTDPEISNPFMERFVRQANEAEDAMILKRAVQTGEFTRLIEELRRHHVIVVGPREIDSFADFARLPSSEHIVIHRKRARSTRAKTEQQIADRIAHADGKAVVLLQAGTLATYWMLRLRGRFPQTRWIDGGLAFDICNPELILRTTWELVYRKEIVRFYNKTVGRQVLSERSLLPLVEEKVTEQADARGDDGPVAFVESKAPEAERIATLLSVCERQNHWANRGPLYEALRESYREFMNVGRGRDVLPCANGGVALEIMARWHDRKRGEPLRWAASAFSFQNIGRGYFTDAIILDCDANGMLSLDELEKLDPESYDGIVVTNPFGLWTDFSAYERFAKKSGKALLLDNAAGIAEKIPDCPYQAFSLHHTKPFGAGEGGLAVLPAGEAEEIYALIDYGELSPGTEPHWLNNGKLSDISCAYLLERLERYPEWKNLYGLQGMRIANIARRAGLAKLMEFSTFKNQSIATSLPFLADKPIPIERLKNPHLVLGKYYKPLQPLPNVLDIFARMVNIPSHSDVAKVSTEELLLLLRDIQDSGM